MDLKGVGDVPTDPMAANTDLADSAAVAKDPVVEVKVTASWMPRTLRTS